MGAELWRLLWSMRGHVVWTLAAAAVLSMTTSVYALLAGPALVGFMSGKPGDVPMLDAVAPEAWAAAVRFETVGGLGAAVLLVAAVKAAAGWAHARATAQLGEAIALELRTRLHRGLLRMTSDDVAAMGSGELASRAGPEVDAVERFAVAGVLGGVRDALQVAALVLTCCLTEPVLGLAALVSYPLLLLPVAWFGRRARAAAQAAQAARGALATVVVDHAQTLSPLQVAGALSWAQTRFTRMAADVGGAAVAAVSARAAAAPLSEVAGAIALVGTLALARARVDAGVSTPESAIAFLAALLLLYTPVKSLVRAGETAAPAGAAWSRLIEVWDAAAEVPVHRGDAAREGGPEAPPGVRLEAVRVVRSGRMVLDLPALTIRAGVVTAVVGPNGAGKTTLAWLLLDLLRPTEGRLAWSPARPIAAAWVPQEGGLLRATWRDNLTLGLPAVSDERLQQALERFGLMTAWRARSEGFDARLDEGGVGLSVGERRRLLMARAWLADAALVVLDEPEAGLDVDGQVEWVTALARLREGRTIVLLTHSAALLEAADDIVRLVDGRRC